MARQEKLSGQEFLKQTEFWFGFRNTATAELEKNIAEFQKVAAKPRNPLPLLLGGLIMLGAVLPTPVSPLFIALKAVLLIGGFAVAAEGTGPSSAVKNNVWDYNRIRNQDSEGAVFIYGLEKQLPFQTPEVRQKFTEAADAFSARRNKFEDSLKAPVVAMAGVPAKVEPVA